MKRIELLRTEWIKCRLTKAEKERIEASAREETNGNMSSYIRKQILNNTKQELKMVP